jgi:hypothetical protein
MTAPDVTIDSTTDTDTETEEAPRTRKRPTPHPCGWCGAGFGQAATCHDRGHLCKGTYRNGVPASVARDRVWHCPCADAGHQGRTAP